MNNEVIMTAQLLDNDKYPIGQILHIEYDPNARITLESSRWEWCKGQLFSKTKYPALYNALRYAYSIKITNDMFESPIMPNHIIKVK